MATLIGVKFHDAEAHAGGVVDQVGDDLLRDFDSAFGGTNAGFIVIHEITEPQPAPVSAAGITSGINTAVGIALRQQVVYYPGTVQITEIAGKEPPLIGPAGPAPVAFINCIAAV